MGQWCGKSKRYGNEQWQDYFEEKLEKLRTFKTYVGRGRRTDVEDFMKQYGVTPRSYRCFPQHILEEIAPVEHACRLGHYSIVGLLLKKGFSPSGMSSESPINVACSLNSTHGVKMFIERYHVDPNGEDRKQRTALSAAIQGNSAGVIQYLLEKLGGKVPMNTLKSIDENGAMMIQSARSGNIQMCQILIDGGFDVNATDLKGNNALLFAAEKFNIDICTLLLKAGSRIVPHTLNRVCGMFRFHGYWRSEKVKRMVRLLAERGAELNHQDERGYTPLHEAIGSYSLTYFLVRDFNVDINKKNNNGDSPDTWGEYSLLDTWGEYSTSMSEQETSYLVRVASNARTLQELSSCVIRRQLGSNIDESIKHLHLPSCIEDIILLKELFHNYNGVDSALFYLLISNIRDDYYLDAWVVIRYLSRYQFITLKYK